MGQTSNKEEATPKTTELRSENEQVWRENENLNEVLETRGARIPELGFVERD